MFKNVIKKLLLGSSHPQEYLCVGFENLSEKFNVSLSFENSLLTEDITDTHIFLGYKPLVIGMTLKKENKIFDTLSTSKKILLKLNAKTQGNNLKNSAQLELKLITIKKFEDNYFFIFEGLSGKHKFLSSFHQFTNRIFQKYKKKRVENIGLPGNLYEQVRIAYAIPRIISVISLGKNNNHNMFPTDLHGAINNDFYVSSLRHKGKACKQVEEIKRLTLSNVSVNSFKEVYSMGRNHMQELKSLENFKTQNDRSDLWNNLLLPETLSYREMELIENFDIGEHRLLFYKIVSHKFISNKYSTLSHIHQYYEVWRKKNGMKTEWMMR